MLPGLLIRGGGGEKAIFSYGIVPRQRALGSKLKAAFRAFFLKIPFILLILEFETVWLGDDVLVLGDDIAVSGGVLEGIAKESEFESVVVVLSSLFELILLFNSFNLESFSESILSFAFVSSSSFKSRSQCP